MPKLVNEQQRINDVIIVEQFQQHGWCRTKQLLTNTDHAYAAGADIEVGTLLEADSAKLKVCRTGSNAAAILLTRVPNAEYVAGDTEVIVLTRGPALVVEDELYLQNGTFADALTALAALGIETREHPEKITTQTT